MIYRLGRRPPMIHTIDHAQLFALRTLLTEIAHHAYTAGLRDGRTTDERYQATGLRAIDPYAGPYAEARELLDLIQSSYVVESDPIT